ncbi:hypothetical protein ACFO1B_44200 [Dactylosporangium siamense]|uniref:Uncharacterized protein n=1 Tax=Dactylosporangium siamense TaxID=685454 RepID=A0A919UHZ0_9ACTN|nr:hypothetical protein [Dactylosporangium siamense]GIG51163.1 hypothetical protein Dsi01nite_092040 [Dactylosporangium siamense]
MHPTQIQVTDTVITARVTGLPAAGKASGADDSVRDALLAAGKYLSEHGWNQREYYADPNAVNPAACLVGALSMVCYGYPAADPSGNVTHPCWPTFATAVQQLNTYADDTFGEIGGVYGFNDVDGRTVGEVLAVLWEVALPMPAPWCECNDETMRLSQYKPFSAIGDGLTDQLHVSRMYTCRACGLYESAGVDNPDDQVVVRALHRVWLKQLPHEGDPHVAGTSEDCDACVEHCHCDSGFDECAYHTGNYSEDGDEYDDGKPSPWHVPGDPQFGTGQGSALGGAE